VSAVTENTTALGQLLTPMYVALLQSPRAISGLYFDVYINRGRC